MNKKTPASFDITEKNRRAIAQIRRTPMPISDVIPLLIESNDEIEKLREKVSELEFSWR
jgi:hypothetical protein